MNNDTKKEPTQTKILHTAAELFYLRGYGQTSIKLIAEQAEIAQGLLYHYFASKDDVLYAVIDSGLDKINEAVASLDQLSDASDQKVMAAINGLLTLMQQDATYSINSGLINQISILDDIAPKVKALIVTKRKVAYDGMAQIFHQGQREGVIVSGDPNQLAVLFWGIFAGLGIYTKAHNDTAGLPTTQLIARNFIKEDQ